MWERPLAGWAPWTNNANRALPTHPAPPHGGTWHSSFPPYPSQILCPTSPLQRLAKTFYHRKNKELPFISSSLNQKEIIIITLTAEPQKQKEHSPNSKPENWWGHHRGESTADQGVCLATLGISQNKYTFGEIFVDRDYGCPTTYIQWSHSNEDSARFLMVLFTSLGHSQ